MKDAPWCVVFTEGRMLMNRVVGRLGLGRLARRPMSAVPTYTERMDKTGRPLSPHLMIYRLPLIAWSSVTVRITGVIGSAMAIGIAGATIVGGGDCASDLVESGKAAYPMLVTPAKFAIAWPLTYHWLGNMRHMYWDLSAKGFNNITMLHSSYGIFALTTAISAGLALCTLPPRSRDSPKK